MALPETALDQALETLLEQVLAIPACRDEHQRARTSFANGRPSVPSIERRADEWFLLERHSKALGGVPLELALHGELALGDEHREALAALLGSQNGIFEVSGIEAGQGVWVRDLLTRGEYALEEPLGSRSLENGDLLAGRLFPVGDGLHRVSRAAGVFRSAPLREALRRDLERARSLRRGLLRLASPELEHMLFEPSSAEEGARCLSQARAVLLRGGLSDQEVAAILERLRSEPFDGRFLPGASDVLGDVLSELAFESAVDLEAARAALLALWPHLGDQAPAAAEAAPREPAAPAAPGRPSARGPRGPREAMEAFDRGRRAGRDLEELFRELERDLELEPDPTDDGEAAEEPAEDERAPDFPGVVGAVVDEYLWELGRERGAEAQHERALLGRLSNFAAPIGLFEELAGPALGLFAAVWLPERGELSGAVEARALLEALRGFCAWVETAHEVPLEAAYAEHVAPLEDELPRIAEANRLLGTGERMNDPGAWFAIRAVHPGRLALEDERGMPATCAVPSALDGRLRPGDVVRAAPDGTGGGAGGGLRGGGDGLTLLCAYPARARDLAQGAPAEA